MFQFVYFECIAIGFIKKIVSASGGVDFQGTFDRIWENHLTELVECSKCKRKFFPNRIEKHKEACIGLKVDVKRPINQLKRR